MTQKGSKRNPYLGSEYINICETSEWRGGWVLYEAANIKCYITQHRTEYRERDGEILGGEYRPYTYAVYDEMKGLEIWEGGWVLPNPNNPDSRGTTYHTVGDEIYGVVNLIPLGEEENPFPIDVYNEMLMNEIWFGGWVLYLSGNKEYIESMYGNGSGSGCGCASGAGCGCGGMHLQAGSEWVTDASVNITGHPGTNPELLISWGEGTFGTSNEPSVSAQITDIGNSSENAISINASWSEPFVVLINDSRLSSIITYSIPLHYRG